MNDAVQQIVDRLIAAERANDAHPLADALAEDFRFVGPAGFVLNKTQFTTRFDSGDLKTTAFDISDVEIREHGSVIVGIGTWRQETTYQGRPNNGNFRLTLVLVEQDGAWRLLNGQLSPMMGPPA